MNKIINHFFQKGWYHGSRAFLLLLPLLWPLSLVFRVLAQLRRWYLVKNRKVVLPVPVIVVGNITVGGTGKTPLLCALAEGLKQRGARPGIISRGYGGSYQGKPRLVSTDDDAAVVGDEPLLLARRTACPVVIGRDRVAAARFLMEQFQVAQGVSVVLSDDGLQHYALPRTVEIAVMDSQRGCGNGFCLPAGPLREPVSRLQRVDFVVSNGVTQTVFRQDQVTMSIAPLCWRNLQTGIETPLGSLPKTTRLHAVAGIGHPQRFFTTLRELGYDITEHVFPDHHNFIAHDVTFADAYPVVMTEKDAVKCAAFAGQDCFALIVTATVPDTFMDAVFAASTLR